MALLRVTSLTGLAHYLMVFFALCSLTVTIPIAVFLLGIWWIAIRDSADRLVNTVLPLGALLVLLDPLIRCRSC